MCDVIVICVSKATVADYVRRRIFFMTQRMCKLTSKDSCLFLKLYRPYFLHSPAKVALTRY